MTQNYKPAYPAEFRHQMTELVALGSYSKQTAIEGIGLPRPFNTSVVSSSGCSISIKPAIAPASVLCSAPLNANARQELIIVDV